MDNRDSRGTPHTATAVHAGRPSVISPAVDQSPFSGPVSTGPLLPGLSLTGAFDSESFTVFEHTAAPVLTTPVHLESILAEPEAAATQRTAATSTATTPVGTDTGSWTIAPNLRARGPAYSVMQECLARQASATARGRLARALGQSPLHSDARSWYSGALGEIVVANALAQLGDAWTVLHAIPVGFGNTDIDHVILGPGGIFTINTKNHSGQKIWIGGSTFLANGYKQVYMRNSAREAEGASRLLSGVTGRPVTVTPLIVVVNPASITTGRKRPRIAVVSSNTLLRWLMKRPRVMSDRAVAHLSMFAEEGSTWHTEPVTTADTTDQLARFEHLRHEVDAARQRARQWLVLLCVGAILITPIAIAEIVRLVVSFLVVPGT